MLTSLKNFFLPHEGNDHHPRLWQMPGTIAFLGVITLVEAFFFTGSYLLINKNGYLASVFPNVLVAFTNDVRTESKVPTLNQNDLLTKAAQAKADDMASRGYFSHYTPEGNSPWTFIREAGYEYKHAGENLAVNFADSKDVVDAWVKSPGHYANLVKETYKEIGIATAEGTYQGKKTIFIVQMFGDPTNVLPRDGTMIASQNTVATSTLVQVATTTVASTPLATTTGVAATAGTVPKVFGLETDTPSTQYTSLSYFDILLTYPRNLAAVVLSLFGSFILILFILSIKSWNTIHHSRILYIALFFVCIISLSLLLNSRLTEGII